MTKKPVLLALIVVAAVLAFAQGDHVPAFNPKPPLPGELLPILPSDQRVGENFKFPYQVHAYELAAKIPGVISQLPCYCYCERIGHKSLHTCYESDHGAHCGICMKEVYYAYQQTKLKKTPAQIREGIIKGEWKSIDLEADVQMN
ncbi:MAG: CYCXC family (seleno)protein [Candidatus Korobacteraceae bacterium]